MNQAVNCGDPMNVKSNNESTRKAKPPLDGIFVLDLSRLIAGPLCAMQLSDMGATVIKVENPVGGDDSRRLHPVICGESHSYLAFNRNKKSVTIDIRTPEGQQIIHDLAQKSDVLIENFRVGVMKRFGLDYMSMKTRHPHLIYVSISAYGQEGPMSDRPGFDSVLQAEFGMMSINGEPDGAPLRHQLTMIDIFTAMQATSATCAALFERRGSKQGQFIDLSLMDSALSALGNSGEYYLVSGEDPPRPGNAHPTFAPSTLFETSTDPIFVALSNDRLFERFCRDFINRPDILEDPRFVDGRARAENRDDIHALLSEIFATDTRDNWLVKLRALPVGPVRTIGEALESDEVNAREMVKTVDHPAAGSVRLVASPYRFSRTPVVEPSAPPLLGADTDAVLHDLLGYNDAKIAVLRENKIIGTSSSFL
jgi:crotonobetainyl-CoA:carnitine CoA-transferase CaiB-like acyl-CoA transferase